MRKLNAVKSILLGLFRVWHGEATAMPAGRTGGNNRNSPRQEGASSPDESLPAGALIRPEMNFA